METETQNPIEIDNLHNAIIRVMQDVKNIDKSMTIGEGRNSYKGVADKDVKFIIGQSMAKNGLTCLPINISKILNQNKMEQTAVEYYNSKIKLFESWVETKQISWKEYHKEKDNLIEQAKEMERKQIERAFMFGQYTVNIENGEQYYNETFKNK